MRTPSSIERLFLADLHENYFSGEPDIQFREWGEAHHLTQDQSDRMFSDWSYENVIEAPCLGPYAALTPAGVLWVEENGLANGDLTRRLNDVRHDLIRRLMEAFQEHGHEGIVDYHELKNEVTYDETLLRANVMWLKDIGMLEFYTMSMMRLTRHGVEYARSLPPAPKHVAVAVAEREPEPAEQTAPAELGPIDIGVPHDRVLLTGAGASVAFGGLLASEFRSAIFNRRQVQEHEELRELLLSTPSFEEALAKVRAGDYRDSAKDALESAVQEVFVTMDDDLRSRNFREGEVNIYGMQSFWNGFAGRRGASSPASAGYIFTLNQDLLLERKWYNFPLGGWPVAHPGVRMTPRASSLGWHWFGTNIPAFSADMDTPVSEAPSLELVGYTNYVKLHGSFNWHSSDGSRAMVLGNGKAQQIEAHTLLAAYKEVFRRVLLAPGVRLMVHGYSFNDPHINRILVEAVENGLEMHVWDPNVWGIMDQLGRDGAWMKIKKGIRGTWQRKLHEVFPGNQEQTSEWRMIQEKFFAP